MMVRIALLAMLMFVGVGCTKQPDSFVPRDGYEEPVPNADVPIDGQQEEGELAAASVPEQKTESAPVSAPEGKKEFVFSDEAFSLRFRSAFIAETSSVGANIRPKEKGVFPEIQIAWATLGAKNSTADYMISLEKQHLVNLCHETDACGTLTRSEVIMFNDRQAVRYVVRVQGRAQDDKDGYIERYHFAIPILRMEHDPGKYPRDTKKYPYWHIAVFTASASDLEKPEEVEASFNNLMATLQLK